MLSMLRRYGMDSDKMFVAGLSSILFAIISWVASRGLQGENLARADRWGIFVGEWAPTFFALGAAMRMEEYAHPEVPEQSERHHDRQHERGTTFSEAGR
ncbi:hypothetical protein SAMN04487820_11645 [Actinopolyspora mzabensis]|uniref:Uncharacterized protein n=1 Tax=Actinopolyspora mzabensis TaxID=995066 RepID=A0A1G9FN13_ACTMZ|nr:hypothetical protein [Actinopolyspora mzabensis]SDK89771.1 hypothetical protein SAMN04487820_11645 [Actinopolyspora mzabensis]